MKREKAVPADNARPFTKIVGYIRVSTKMQGESGLGLAAQRLAIEGYARQVGAPIVAWFEEVESGTRSDRPQLAAAIRRCELTGAALVAAKIDRFGRKASDLFKLRDARFPVVAVDTPNADSFVWGVLALVAEKERDSIALRTKAALGAARARGQKLGKPENLTKNTDIGRQRSLERRAAAAEDRALAVLPVIDDIREAGAKSLRKIAATLNEMGITTARGGEWSAVQVSRVLARSE